MADHVKLIKHKHMFLVFLTLNLEIKRIADRYQIPPFSYPQHIEIYKATLIPRLLHLIECERFKLIADITIRKQ